MWRRPSKTEPESDAVRRARDTARKASIQREQVEAGLPEAQAIGSQLRKALERNHFGESIERALLRRGST